MAGANDTETGATLETGSGMLDPQGNILRRVKLLPYGRFEGRDGRGPWTLEGKTHAEEVIAATRRLQGGADILFDYDHQSALSAVPGVGGMAKAAGWIKPDTLTAEADGIYGDVEWTRPAEAAILAKEYRYYSPHFRFQRETGRITRLVNVGLTNSPNLDVPALASQRLGDDPVHVAPLTNEERAVCAALGLPEVDYMDQKQREAQAQAALCAKSGSTRSGITNEERAVCTALGLSEVDYMDQKRRQAQAAPGAKSDSVLSAEERRTLELLGMSESEFLAAREAQRQQEAAS